MDKTKILVADDGFLENSGIDLFLDKFKLDRKELSVIVAKKDHSVVDILTILNDERPDLVLWDITMPLANGCDINEIMESSDLNKRIPLVFISSNTQVRDKVISYDDISSKLADLEKTSSIDPITNLYNRRYLESRIDEEISRAKRYNFDLSCLVIDIDHFKSINDNFGHQVGDSILMQVSRTFEDVSRTNDVLVRYGGDEFVIVLPQTDMDGAYNLAERMRIRVKESDYIIENLSHKVTVSIGVTSLTNEQINKDLLIKQADMALYKAKNAGRNKVVKWSYEMIHGNK